MFYENIFFYHANSQKVYYSFNFGVRLQLVECLVIQFFTSLTITYLFWITSNCSETRKKGENVFKLAIILMFSITFKFRKFEIKARVGILSLFLDIGK